MTSVDEVVLPGSAARLRSMSGVSGPQDVPVWMTHGGGSVRVAASRVATDAVVVRRAGDIVRSVLFDAAGALGWRGPAASASEQRAGGLWGQLAVVADQLDDAQQALAGLAVALDGQAPALGSARTWSGSWSTDPAEQKSALAARWGPAVSAIDVADARAADALQRAAAALGRVRVAVGRDGWLDDGASRSTASSSSSEPSLLASAAGFVGRACAGLVDGLEAVAVAAGEHPEAVAELLAGTLLMQAGASGEVGGALLDATGVGAVAGVPAGVVSAGALATGAGLMTMGVGTLGSSAAGESRGGSGARGGSGGSGRIDIENATYAQKGASWRFSKNGKFGGQTIGEVARDLGLGRLKPEDVPIDAIKRDGHSLILNTRSGQALERAGIPRSRWLVRDRTGQPTYEARLSQQLKNNDLDSEGTSSVEIGFGGR